MNYHCDLAVSITIGEFATRHHHTYTHKTSPPQRSRLIDRQGFADRAKVNYNRSTAFSVKMSLPAAAVVFCWGIVALTVRDSDVNGQAGFLDPVQHGLLGGDLIKRVMML